MKGCFVLQRRFAYIGHELAVLLKQEHGVDSFCAFVQTRESYQFLQNQKEILYSQLLLDEDIQSQYTTQKIDFDFLKQLETDYGIPNLWPYVNVDRIIRFGQLVREYPHNTSPYTYEEMLRILQVYAKKIHTFLEEEKPDFIFSSQPGSIATLLLHEMAKKRGIKIVMMVLPCLKNQVALSERYDRLTGAETLLTNNKSLDIKHIPFYEDAIATINEFRNKPTTYSEIHNASRRKFKRRQYFDFLLPLNLLRSSRWFLGMIYSWFGDKKYRDDYSTVHPWGYFKDRVRRKIRNIIGLDDLYDDFDTTKKFVFFPLHLEPEIALVLLAPFATNQIEVIKHIAQSLPIDTVLYVKEHPQMVPLRPRSFYKEIKKIPNVRLINPRISGYDVMRHAALVTVITGTVGWEATLMGKPVITFGNIFYNALSFVGKSRIPEELPILIQEKIRNTNFNEEELTRFVAAILEDSIHTDILYLWELESDQEKKRAGLKDFANLIAHKIEGVV